MPKRRRRKSAAKNDHKQTATLTAPAKPTRRRWLAWTLAGAGVTAAGVGGWFLVNNMFSHVAQYTYEIVNEYDHDPAAFTQGLVYHDGFLYEGTGGQHDELGISSLRKVNLEDGRVVKSIELDEKYFGEGIALWNDKIIQLTWRNRRGFVYEDDRETFRRVHEFHYDGQGWGLTDDGRHLIMSDGTNRLRFLDPEKVMNLKHPPVEREIAVHLESETQHDLNELEYIDGEIYANVFQTDTIVRISPRTGQVVGRLDLQGLRPPDTFDPDGNSVLNGIAWDDENHRLFVTGKRWPVLYEIRQIPL